jgi:hypothetical protein
MHVFKTELNQRLLEIKRPQLQHQGALFHAAHGHAGGLFLKPQAQQAVSIPSVARFFVTTPIDDLNRRTLSRECATIIQLRRAPPTCFVVAAGQGTLVWPPQAVRSQSPESNMSEYLFDFSFTGLLFFLVWFGLVLIFFRGAIPSFRRSCCLCATSRFTATPNLTGWIWRSPKFADFWLHLDILRNKHYRVFTCCQV